MIKKLLIANRGEIACRVMRTAADMGIRTVAVYSDADANAMHVRRADQAVNVGPAEAVKSYLNVDAILNAARETGADAVHPGYGFFSENADFADAVRAAGMIFVGPPSQAIRDMGAKDNAKAIMEKANVPIVPGYYGADQSLDLFKSECGKIGYPVLLKAALGGGGKGMRVVNSASELEDGIAGAKRESLGAFGDDRLLIEKYLTNTRHVEVQVFADSQGNCVHLFERDCSLQRRHQKIIEEAPAPGLSDDVRKSMGEAAVRAAQAVNYEGAGTVEFLLGSDGHFYFMEMNTRLQVEHPVSEMITGTDLVEWQLRVAAGEALAVSQGEITCSGHAIEARLYAEDPSNGFMPAPGPVHHLVWPKNGDGVRIDTGVAAGDVISPHYDPMIAKVICWGETRDEARQKLHDSLSELQIIGPGSNSAFLNFLLDHPVFREARMDTAFVDGLDDASYAPADEPQKAALVAAAEYVVWKRDDVSNKRAQVSSDPYSPWNMSHSWRMNDTSHQDLTFLFGSGEEVLSYHVSIFHEGIESRFSIEGEQVDADGVARAREAEVVDVAGTINVFGFDLPVSLTLFDPITAAGEHEGTHSSFASPMPGRIAAVEVSEGESVAKGDVLVVVEAMKMEHAITAPRDGVVGQIMCAVGDQVDEGHELLKMTE